MSSYKQCKDEAEPAQPCLFRLYKNEVNPYGHQVLLLLDAKNIDYEVYALSELPHSFYFYGPIPRLNCEDPVLAITSDGCTKYLFDTMVICEYLDEQWAYNKLQSIDPYMRAQDRQLICRFNDLITGCIACFDTYFESGHIEIKRTLALLEEVLRSRETSFFGGMQPGMLDFMIWPWIERLDLIKFIDRAKYEAIKYVFKDLEQWRLRMLVENVIKKHFTFPEVHLTYYWGARRFGWQI